MPRSVVSRSSSTCLRSFSTCPRLTFELLLFFFKITLLAFDSSSFFMFQTRLVALDVLVQLVAPAVMLLEQSEQLAEKFGGLALEFVDLQAEVSDGYSFFIQLRGKTGDLGLQLVGLQITLLRDRSVLFHVEFQLPGFYFLDSPPPVRDILRFFRSVP
eukprot:GABU01003837.1.p2 GENE.GABU01003837.1~~GABU01003837.1.p2  ORF type:complete len:158 (+),score=15.01 GABU01003837.1:59-532(+)